MMANAGAWPRQRGRIRCGGGSSSLAGTSSFCIEEGLPPSATHAEHHACFNRFGPPKHFISLQKMHFPQFAFRWQFTHTRISFVSKHYPLLFCLIATCESTWRFSSEAFSSAQSATGFTDWCSKMRDKVFFGPSLSNATTRSLRIVRSSKMIREVLSIDIVKGGNFALRLASLFGRLSPVCKRSENDNAWCFARNFILLRPSMQPHDPPALRFPATTDHALSSVLAPMLAQILSMTLTRASP